MLKRPAPSFAQRSGYKSDDQATDSSSLKYFSASMAAAQPEPAAVIACL
jgi:hypothetical protein